MYPVSVKTKPNFFKINLFRKTGLTKINTNILRNPKDPWGNGEFFQTTEPPDIREFYKRRLLYVVFKRKECGVRLPCIYWAADIEDPRSMYPHVKRLQKIF